VSIPAPIDHEGYEDAWDLTMAVNLTAYVRMIRACLDDLRRDGAGRIVNIASTEGLGATAMISPYTASKHGVIGLTRALAVELGPAGVTVNCVCPGPIRTGMTAAIPDEAKERFARRRVPMRRYGDPEEVAHAIVSLLCQRSVRSARRRSAEPRAGGQVNRAVVANRTARFTRVRPVASPPCRRSPG
jgi:3-oxoacyl-[acyl-carrier protein] reductase